VQTHSRLASGPADRSRMGRDLALQLRSAELRRAFARRLLARQKMPFCMPPRDRTGGDCSSTERRVGARLFGGLRIARRPLIAQRTLGPTACLCSAALRMKPGRRGALLRPRPPQNRTCGADRIRLKQAPKGGSGA